MMSPCKDCPDRFVGCHSKCERYQAYSDKVKGIRERRERDNDFIGYQREQMRKQIRVKRRFGK